MFFRREPVRQRILRHVFFAGGDPIAISGAPIAENSLALTGGFAVNLTPTARLGLTYDGQIGSNAVDHGLTADFRLTF